MPEWPRGYKAQREWLLDAVRIGAWEVFRGREGNKKLYRLWCFAPEAFERARDGLFGSVQDRSARERELRLNPPPCPVCRLPMLVGDGGIVRCAFARLPRHHVLAARATGAARLDPVGPRASRIIGEFQRVALELSARADQIGELTRGDPDQRVRIAGADAVAAVGAVVSMLRVLRELAEARR